MHIYITGFMAVGKTTLGKRLAKALERPFVDTDMLIEGQQGISVARLFEESGEDVFRLKEAEALRSIKDNKPAVVATGGGLPCYYDNMAFMNQHGTTLYLQAEPAFIQSRLIKARVKRPLVKSLDEDALQAFITQKLAEREYWYLQAKLVVKVPGKSAESLVNTVVEALGRLH